ncbi:hypothetical protein BCR33DRAFT_719471 [Rhizoclosmatium globosum]|uniref:P-loop containing nucleoside triphosphate hydrolase protein n=1 Tax=Rhizoclosmatium globosum TaxID=329046 RepID=A0A1Y2C0H1_9FUNG|nr:hypothetical protein BCR33DRAFT_719471 [Rhizoclosmatium globosum]|eukprot:ORY40509.1 hypothetical protein BCR33DRAFT_719471 [Rhizoclosmatium globosum]
MANVPFSQLPKPNRIRITGLSGSGKSHLGARLATLLSVPHAQEDSFHFSTKDFIMDDKQTVDARTLAFTTANASKGYVTDGFWRDINHIMMPQINVVIELQYPIYIILWQLMKRSVWRCWTGEKLWGTDNVETVWSHLKLWDNDNVFGQTIRVWWNGSEEPQSAKGKLRRDWFREGWPERGIVPQEYCWTGDRMLLVFKHPTELDVWLREVEKMN